MSLEISHPPGWLLQQVGISQQGLTMVASWPVGEVLEAEQEYLEARRAVAQAATREPSDDPAADRIRSDPTGLTPAPAR
jgi:hypothetical protein